MKKWMMGLLATVIGGVAVYAITNESAWDFVTVKVWGFLSSPYALSFPIWGLLLILALLVIFAIIFFVILSCVIGTTEEDIFGFRCKYNRDRITGYISDLQYLCPKCDMELEQRPSGCDDIFLLVCTHCKEILPVDRVFGEENLDLKVKKEIERRRRVQQNNKKEGK